MNNVKKKIIVACVFTLASALSMSFVHAAHPRIVSRRRVGEIIKNFREGREKAYVCTNDDQCRRQFANGQQLKQHCDKMGHVLDLVYFDDILGRKKQQWAVGALRKGIKRSVAHVLVSFDQRQKAVKKDGAIKQEPMKKADGPFDHEPLDVSKIEQILNECGELLMEQAKQEMIEQARRNYAPLNLHDDQLAFLEPESSNLLNENWHKYSWIIESAF